MILSGYPNKSVIFALMARTVFKKMLLFMALLLAAAGVWFFVQKASLPAWSTADKVDPKINLALRRTAHMLFVAAGDSTSRIPPVEHPEDHIWQIRLERSFNYDLLPTLLQEALDVHQIKNNYDVAVLNCLNKELQLGYNGHDFLANNTIPCGGREMAKGCYILEVNFYDLPAKKRLSLAQIGGLLMAGLLGLFFYLGFRQRKPQQVLPIPEEGYLNFGKSRLDVTNQVLYCGEVRHELTYRETKLLRLFATQPNQLLERSFILEQVWADEGILVGRSIDVFVSRLRKILRDDPNIQVVAVHGVGYRMEIKNS